MRIFSLPQSPVTITSMLIVVTGPAGAIDEESFLSSFEDVPMVNLFSPKEFEDQMKTIRETIGNDKKDWKIRIDAVIVAIVLYSMLLHSSILIFNFPDEKTTRHNKTRRHQLRILSGTFEESSEAVRVRMHGFEVASAARGMHHIGLFEPAAEKQIRLLWGSRPADAFESHTKQRKGIHFAYKRRITFA